jgi:hypothetical protein
MSMVLRSFAAGTAGAFSALVICLVAPGAASAATTLIGGCHNTDISPAAGECYGYFQGNVNGNSGDMQAAQTEALTALGLSGPFTAVQKLDIASGTTIDFNQLLSGATYISIHWGKGEGASDVKGGVTGFYRLDLDPDAQLDQITSDFGSLSNAVLWSTVPGGLIPEPATWAMMILGFSGSGVLLRRRRTPRAASA